MKFGIKKETRRDGITLCTPIAKEDGMFSYWKQIQLVNNKRYQLESIDDPSDLSEEECKAYIEGFKKQLEEKNSKEIINTEIVEYD